MPGNYNPPTRQAGENIDDTKYNSDHAVHRDNHTLQQLDDLSVSVAEMQSRRDQEN